MKEKSFCINYILRELKADSNKKLNDITAMRLFGEILYDAGISQNKKFDNKEEIIRFKQGLNLDIDNGTQLKPRSKRFIDNERNDITPDNQLIRKIILSYVDKSFSQPEECNLINKIASSINNRLGNLNTTSVQEISQKFNKEYQEFPELIKYVNKFSGDGEVLKKMAWFIIIACFPRIDEKTKNWKKSESGNDYLQSLVRIINLHDDAPNINDDRLIYQKKYHEPFVLHKRDGLVAFDKDVYVSPECEFRIYNERNNSYPTIIETGALISNLNKIFNSSVSPQPNLCVLLGHGASGKTSFVTMISSNPHLLVDGIDYHVLMLRRFSDVKYSELCNEIEKNCINASNNALIILDGLDELCMMRNDIGEATSITIVQELCSRLLIGNRKLIITSRPGYIDSEEVWDNIRSYNRVYGLIIGRIMPFDHKKRVEFVNKLIQADKSLALRPECEWVCNLRDNEKINEVYSLPFFIYLIVASSKAPEVAQKPITEMERNNKWALFRRLFHDIYFDSNYWDYDNTSRLRNEIKKLKDDLYTVSGHVAWKMCSEKLGNYYCTTDQIKEIISKLNYNPRLIDEISDFYPVSSYINKNGNKNAYEFAHNYVRDFFLCEFVLSNLNYMIDKPDAHQQIINWAKSYLYPHNLKQTSNAVAHGGHWVLEFIEDYDLYYTINAKESPYKKIVNYSSTRWNSIFYYLYHEMKRNNIVEMGKSYNENVFNNLKSLYLSLYQSHDTLDTRIVQHSSEALNRIKNVRVNDKIVFGLNEWYVLSIKNDYVRLISAVAFLKKYHDIDYYNYTINNISWDNSTLRSWLNHDFFNYFFSNYEKRAISNVHSRDVVTLLDSNEWKELDDNIQTGMLNNTSQIIQENGMQFPHPNAKFTIHSKDTILTRVSSGIYGYKWSESFDINHFGMAFPVITLYYKDLTKLRNN